MKLSEEIKELNNNSYTQKEFFEKFMKNNYIKKIEQLEKENEELKNKINKTKSCCTCSNYVFSESGNNFCSVHHTYPSAYYQCDDWELK